VNEGFLVHMHSFMHHLFDVLACREQCADRQAGRIQVVTLVTVTIPRSRDSSPVVPLFSHELHACLTVARGVLHLY